MKLLRWAAAGASVFAIYKYSIGRKAQGDAVLISPERAIANLTQDGAGDDASATDEGGKQAPAKRTHRKK